MKTDVMQVGFIDSLLQGNKPRHSKASTHRRKRSQARKAATPEAAQQAGAAKTDTPANIPIPVPKPADQSPAPVPDAAPSVPLPETKPELKPETKPEIKPEAKPDNKSEAKPEAEPETGKDAVPPDAKEPDAIGGKETDVKPAVPAQQPEQAEIQPEIVHEDPAEVKACLAELDQLGTRYQKIDPIPEDNGCGIEQPIKVDDVLPGLSLGGATMRCQTALGLAHWLKNTVQPAIEVARPGRKLTGIVPGTTFACRLRNNAASGMISEHARGNGFDVAAFKFDNGETLDMKPRQDDHTMEGAFQKATTAGACLYFTTVLAPGSDAAHETHMHVDVKERENGYRICDTE